LIIQENEKELTRDALEFIPSVERLGLKEVSRMDEKIKAKGGDK